MRRGRLRWTAAVAAVVWIGASCTPRSPSTDAAPDLRGQRLEVLAVWSGDEQEAFAGVVRGFEGATGASVTYTSVGHGMAPALDARLAEGRPPDVAFLPQPGLLRRYGSQGKLVPLDDVVGKVVERNYGQPWRSLGSSDGRLYGVWFKAANKSLIWYNVGSFERLGLVPPEDLDGLLRVAEALVASGLPAFSVAGGDGWTLTDWFENVYLRLAGRDRYDELARHGLAWTDESVKEALRLLDRMLDGTLLAGGVEGALATRFAASVQAVISKPPTAAMAFEGDFVAGVVAAATDVEPAVDVDVFAFPRVARSLAGALPAGGGSPVVAGGDAAVLLRASEVGTAFLRYLATPEAAAAWAVRGGFLSPNRNVDLSAYPDDLTRSLARSLLEAGDDLGFDLSDLAPASFGSVEGQGLRGALQQFLRTRDVEATASRLEADAAAAYPR